MSATIATTQSPIPKMLADAQAHLRSASWNLAKWRRVGIYSNRDERMLREAEQDFLAALDRVWDVQCMTVASF